MEGPCAMLHPSTLLWSSTACASTAILLQLHRGDGSCPRLAGFAAALFMGSVIALMTPEVYRFLIFDDNISNKGKDVAGRKAIVQSSRKPPAAASATELELPAGLPDLGLKRRCPPTKKEQELWLLEQRNPPSLDCRVATSLNRVGGNTATQAMVLKAAWRDVQRDPSAAIRLAEMVRLNSLRSGEISLYSRSAFLVGKILVEVYNV